MVGGPSPVDAENRNGKGGERRCGRAVAYDDVGETTDIRSRRCSGKRARVFVEVRPRGLVLNGER